MLLSAVGVLALAVQAPAAGAADPVATVLMSPEAGLLMTMPAGIDGVASVVNSSTASAEVDVEAFDVTGKPLAFHADGLLAVCIQHELDHLNGKLFIDYLSPLQRDMVRRKLEKAHRLAAASA